jgi:predicted transposase/invertase (TIGR01784 family)
MEHHLQQYPQEKQLPIVFSILYYHGKKRPYPYSLDVFDLFADRVLAKETFTKPAHLVDLAKILDKQIKQYKLIGLLTYTQKHIWDQDFALLVNDLKEIIIKASKNMKINEDFLLYLRSNLHYIIEIANIENEHKFIQKLEEIPFIKGYQIVGNLARKWRDEGKAEGMTENSKKIAINLLNEGLSIQKIAKVTGLAMSEIETLQKINH